MKRTWTPDPECRCNFCQTGTRDGFGHDDGPTWLRDREDPEDFYDYVAEWREAQKQRRVILWIALGCILGGVIGVSLLILGAVR